MSEDKKTPESQQEPEIKEEAKSEAKKAEEKPSDKKQDKKESKAAGEKKEEQSSPAEELKGANDRYLRLLAEYDNYRKRSQKEKDSLYADIKSDTVAKFLPVYDNLVRAPAQSTEDEAYRRGVEMIMTQFNTTLEKLGATKIECLGQKFDPSLHNAVMHVEDEEKGENEIVEVFQEGFRMGEKVIRYAMVKVAN